jgi:aminoglycoside phosphotransferase (APT) family kinase protein
MTLLAWVDDKHSPSAASIDALRKRYPTERTVDEALSRKMLARSGPPYAPVSTAEIEERLRTFFAEHEPSSAISSVAPLGGGASKEQYRFDLSRRDQTPETYVLRREPPESVVETHRLREYQLMRAISGTVPVPDVPWVDADGRWFARPALISRFVQGVTKPPAGDSNVTGLGAEYSPELRRSLGAQFVDLFAKIHMFDWREADLSAFDAPPEGSDEGVQWVVNWWERVWEEDSSEPMPMIRFTAQWLRDNAPKIEKVTVVHHDYRAGNFLFDPTTTKVTAVLDWELAHLGDYHEDLAWTLQEGYGKLDDQGRFLVCGLIDRDIFLSRWEEKTGLSVDRRKLAYYAVMNCWKSAIMVLATGVRCAMGGKSHQDVLLAWLAGFGPTCVHTLNKRLREAIDGS